MLKNNVRTVFMRKAVTQALNKIWEYPLTVVEAPMGYGKTTTIKEYVKTSNSEVLWQTVLDESVHAFWNGFCRLFKKISPDAANKLLAIGIPSNNVFSEEAVWTIEEIKFQSKTLLVLDDYHLISSEDIDVFLEKLVKSDIPNLHILIISRSVFGDNTNELMLKGYCHVINKKHLVLSREETIEYCGLCGVKLTKEEIDFLLSYTEGWISAIYLCLQGFLQEGRLEHQITLHELLDKVVYQRISLQARKFLLHICIFDTFTLEQAEFIWHEGNVESLLRELESNNAFIKYEHTTKRYYIHNIFTSYLRRIFERQSIDKKQTVWTLAGKWHVSIGKSIHALDYFYQAGAFAELLAAIELDKGNSIYSEHKEKLIRYFSECPSSIKQDHLKACLIYTINLFSFNEMELFAEECQCIGEWISVLPHELALEKNQLMGELELLCSFAKYNHITGMAEHIERAASLLTSPSDFIDRNSSWTFGSPSVLYMFYRESGQLEQTVNEMRIAIKQYCQLTAGHGAGADALMQAEWYYYTGDFENAEILVYKASHTAHLHHQTAIVLCAQFLQLRLAIVNGESQYIMNNLRKTQEDLKQQGMYQYLHTWDMCEGFIYAHLNLGKKISAWIVNGDLQDRTIYFPSYAFFNIVWGKVLLLNNQHLKLNGLAESFMEISSVFPNLLGQVYTYIFEAAAKSKLGHHANAKALLTKALDIAVSDQLIMPFVENGEYIDDLLADFETSNHHAALILKIRKLIPLVLKNRKTISAQLTSNIHKLPLTDREWTIAELIATGLTNRDIGNTLHIAEITVKKALQNIYEKLGIRSRTALTKIVLKNEQ